MKIFGSDLCPWCRDCKENFERNGIPYTWIDINASIRNLGIFLKIRDSNPVFDPAKAVYDIGIPALVDEDRTVILDWQGWIRARGGTVELHHVQTGAACSLDGKGC